MKRGLAWALGLVIFLPALAILAALLMFDGEALRPRLVAEVERATGRAFTVREVRLALSLRPALELREVTVANSPGGSRPTMLRAERVAVQLALLPLLSRRVEIARLEIDRPDLLLEIDGSGRGNWLFAPPREAPRPEAARATEGTPSRPLRFHLEALILGSGQVTWRGGPGASAETIAIGRLEATAPADGPAQVTAQGDFRGQAFTLRATTGPLMAFGGAAPWPIEAQLGVAGLSAALGLELAEAPRALTLRLGEADLGQWWPSLRLTALEARAATLNEPLLVEASAMLGELPLRIQAQTAPPGALLANEAGDLPLDVRLSAGPALEAEAALRLRARPRPRLAGQILVSRLDLDAVPRAQERAPSAPAAPTPPPASPPPTDRAPGSTRLIPSIPIPYAALRAADADLDLRIAALTTGGATTRDIAGRLLAEGGKVRLAPLSATTPAGALTLEIEADATATPPRLRVAARSAALDAALLAAALGAEPWLLGPLYLDADLRGSGEETRGWAGSLAGHLGLAMVDGALSRAALRRLPGAALEVLAPGGLPPGDIPVRCLALGAPIEAGVLRLATFSLDGGLGSLGGGGSVDLGQETLALRLLADLRPGRISVRAPVTINGPWRAPRIGVDLVGAAAAGLGALLSFQRTPDRALRGLADALGGGRGAAAGGVDCDAALAAARGGGP